MSAAQGHDPSVRAIRLVNILLALSWLIALIFYLGTRLNNDTSWSLVVAQRLLDGQHLYRDIIELNPPLAFYLAIPPVLAAPLIDITPSVSFIAYIFGLIAISLGLVRVVLARLPAASALYRNGMLVAVFVALVLLPMPVFGQREHLMLILALPYIVLVAARLHGAVPSSGCAILIGIIAAAGLGLKPYFLIVPAMLEIYVLCVRRSLSAILRAELLALSAGLAAYGMFILIVTPAYVSFIVPAGLLVYDAFSSSLRFVLAGPNNFPLLLSISVYALVKTARVGRRATDIFALAAAGFFIEYVVQSKGWDYQRLPAETTAWLTAAGAFLDLVEDKAGAAGKRGRLRLTWAAGVLASLMSVPFVRGTFSDSTTDRLLPIVREYASGGSIYLFTSYMPYSFPLVNEARVHWSSRFPTQWLLPGAAHKLENEKNLDPATAARLRDIERFAVDAHIEDLREMPPDLLIVDTGFPNYLDYFRRDQRFLRLWAGYSKVGTISIPDSRTAVNFAVPGDGAHHFEIWCRRGHARHCPDDETDAQVRNATDPANSARSVE